MYYRKQMKQSRTIQLIYYVIIYLQITENQLYAERCRTIPTTTWGIEGCNKLWACSWIQHMSQRY